MKSTACSIDDHAEVEPVLEELAFLVGRIGGKLMETRERGLAAQLVDAIAFGARDRERITDRTAALRHDRAHGHAVDEHTDCAGIDHRPVDDEPVATGVVRGRRHAPDHLKVREVLIESCQERINRERERIREQQQRRRRLRKLGPARDRRAVGRLLDAQQGGREAGIGQSGREHRHSRLVLELAFAGDDRDRGAAQEHLRLEQPPDSRRDVFERARVVRRDERHHQIGAIAVELIEHLTEDFADSLGGNRMLRDGGGECAHEGEATGTSDCTNTSSTVFGP